MTKPHYTHVGDRIRERMIAQQYVRPDGEVDVDRFSWDYRFGRTNLYNWLSNETVPFKDLTRLCDALDCSERWLLTGVERRRSRLKRLVVVGAVGVSALLLPSVGRSAEPRGDGNYRLATLPPPSYRKWRVAYA